MSENSSENIDALRRANSGNRIEERIAFTGPYTSSHYAERKLKKLIPFSIYESLQNANLTMTVIGGSDFSFNPPLGEKLRHIVSKTVLDLATTYQDKIAVISGGGNRGAMLDGQLARELAQTQNRDFPVIGVDPAIFTDPQDKYSTQEIKTMPKVIRGESLSHVLLVDTNHRHEYNERRAWRATSELLTSLSRLRRRGTPSITIVSGGGEFAELETLNKLRQGEDVFILKGSGRWADALADLKALSAKPWHTLSVEDKKRVTSLGNIAFHMFLDKTTLTGLLTRIHVFDMGKYANEETITREFGTFILSEIQKPNIEYVGTGRPKSSK